MIHNNETTRGLIELHMLVHGGNTMVTWKKVSERRYWDMLGVLPPAIQTGAGFLVGEPMDHRRCSVTRELLPRFSAFVEKGDEFFEARSPMTIPEFKAVKLAEVG